MAKAKSPLAAPLAPPRHRGNKADLPSKLCVACGLPMTWRRSWAKNWDEVKYCSDACRRKKGRATPV
ncbi:DUF2256 domain-containing protein [Xylophilus sp. GOD-11R]|uniref:DUF2256 domain-containing protein n=1 Tax=Xylophilus sp. GOD-11R TaxID=3089814 RepID=UPI00298D3F37|nr:DUF2256 domain-containing protein [Xylophilus sp. GOD-11R]WPB58349.1 DUF2256 domain-containing protein [Xylophilus sp. GOD-11R]